jgi:hypothetical protein
MACGRDKRQDGASESRVQVLITVDWEGAFFSPAAVDALEELRSLRPHVPLSHFLCPSYLTKSSTEAAAPAFVASALGPHDEVGLHLHAWESLARASGVEPRLSPSFLTGTDALLEFADEDRGFDVDLDAYSTDELRMMLRTSRALAERLVPSVSSSFRAGGYLSTPKVLHAARAEGFTIDSSATSAVNLANNEHRFLTQRVREVWPEVTPSTTPFVRDTPAGTIIEMPIAAVVDYASEDQLRDIFVGAARSAGSTPTRDIFIVFALHQETADEFAPKLGAVLRWALADDSLKDRIELTTVQEAASRWQRRVRDP